MLGQIVVGRGILDAPFVKLSEYGNALAGAIEFMNNNNHEIGIVKYVIMPNHVHMIVVVDNLSNGASGMPRPTNALIPKLISSIKRFVNRQAGFNLWQRSFHDHIIRSDDDYIRILQYIEDNPARWREDVYYVPHLA